MVKKGKLAVLVAENNPAERALICACLEGLGIYPDAAANGREAVAASRSRVYDFIFLACRMPVLDGPAAALEIRANEAIRSPRSHRAHIVGMTAEVLPASPQKAVPPGMNALIGSPWNEAVLREQLGFALTDPSGL